MSIKCGARFRPCIDIHKGKVKQIVGSTLQDLKEGGSSLVTNFESDKSAAEYASLYKEDGLTGGHVIMLGADPLSKSAATEALHAYPGGLQVGGGINADNALSYIEEGASHVIVTSYVFNNGQMDLQRLKYLVRIVGKQRLVLDLSCRKKGHSQKMSLALAYSYFQRLFLQLLARFMQCSWLGECRARYRRSAYFIQVSQSSVQLVSAILVTLIVLGILASLVA